MNGRTKQGNRGRSGAIHAACVVAVAALLAPASAQAQQPIACIAADSSPERIAEQIFAAATAMPQAANVDDTWTRTATDGSGIDRGEPITLTWSVVPDGTAIEGALDGEGNDPSNLEAFLDANHINTITWLTRIQIALDSWTNGPGIQFVYEPNDDGVGLNTGLPSQDIRGSLGVRGDIRIGGHDIDGDFGTVAYAFFPNGGDIVIDTNDLFNTTREGLQNSIAHEAGHAIGLGHVCPLDGTKLMEPIIDDEFFFGAQFDDLLGAHRNYGDTYEENDDEGEAADLGLAFNTVTNAAGIALDGTNDDDWYTIPAGKISEVSIQLDPAGTPYQFRAIAGSNCSGGPEPEFDPRDVQDMTLNVYDFDGTTLLASSDATGIGGSESLSDVRLSSFGGFIEITQDVGSNEAQAYELEITLVPEPARFALQAAAIGAIGWLARTRHRRSAR